MEKNTPKKLNADEWITEGDVPSGFSPESSSFAGTDSDCSYVNYTWSFGGNAPFFENKFSASLNTSISLNGQIVGISVSSDDNAKVEIADIGSVSSTLNKPNSNCFFKADGSNYSGSFPLSISYNTIGGPWFLRVSIRVAVPKYKVALEKECLCSLVECGMASSAKSGSVDFSQPFGHTPFAAEFPAGQLRIYDRIPVSELFSGKGLRYLHPMTRRVKSIAGTTVVIVDDLETEYSYVNGRPAGTSVWTDNQVKILPDGRVVEILDDRTEITFDAEGKATSIKSPAQIGLAVNALGIDVVRDESGRLLQVWSQTDGLMNVVSVSALKFRVDWYKGADVGEKGEDGLYTFTGTPVKKFHFGDIDGDESCAVFELLEERPVDALSFHYSWKYDDSKRDWLFVRGDTGPASVKSTKEKIFSEDGATVQIKEWQQVGNGQKKLYSIETYAYGEDGEKLIGREVDGVVEYSATRVTSGNGRGKIASETDKYGNTKNYTYDAYARLRTLVKTKGYAGLPEETSYTYADVPADAVADLRPLTITQKIDGTIFRTETFSYNDNAEAGRVETHAITASGTTLTSEARYYSSGAGTPAAGRVQLEISPDNTATLHEYTSLPANDLAYTETVTEGIFENGAFAVVPAKSTRMVRTINARGDEVRTEDFVHTGTQFVSTYWVEKSYSPTHKVISSIDSVGKTTSADYICTGALWTVDEEGVRTENVYNQAKQILTSTRKGVRGDVVTRYTYDAQGRVISERKSFDPPAGDESPALVQATSRTYNIDGTLAMETDALGNVTSYAYVLNEDGTETETVTYPDTGTRIVHRDVDQQTLSITGTSLVSQFYSYAFDVENALKITTVLEGSLASKRWKKVYTDGHGRTVRTEKPGVGENVVLSVENSYAGARLIRKVAMGEPTIDYVYDVLGNTIETKRSVSGNLWRKNETDSIYESTEDGIVWKKTTNVESCSDTEIVAQTTIQKTQLSGLSLALESKQISIDVRGNETVTVSHYDVETKMRTQTSTFPHVTGEQVTKSVDGVVVSQVSPAGISVSSVFDAFNRQVSSTDSRGNTTTFTYNANDQLLSETKVIKGEDVIVNRYLYDAHGRQVRTTFANETFTASAYNLRGNKVAEYGNASYPMLAEFDLYNQRIGLQTFRTLAGTPEELANLIGGDETKWSFDEATGVLLSKTDANEESIVYTYTTTGLLAARAWARGVTTAYSYDDWKQLVAIAYSDTTANVTHTYDAHGREAARSDAAGTTTFSYNAYNEKIEESVSSLSGKTITYHLDTFGRDLGYSIGGVRKTTLSYDPATGFLVGMSAAGSNWVWFYLEGTALKQQITAPNALNTLYTYETDRDLLASVTNSRAETTFSKYDYVYDELGRRTAMTKSGTMMASAAETIPYTYNDRSETTGATSDTDTNYNYTYAFDNIGNRETTIEASTQANYTTNALNQYSEILKEDVPPAPENPETPTNAAPFVPTFDADGNQTLIKTTTGIWQVSYNAENRPVEWTNSATNTSVEMIYDSQGRRISRRTLVGGVQSIFTRFYYKGYVLVQELYSNAPYDVYREFIWDPTESQATKPLFMKHKASNLLYTHDGNKNVSEVVFFNPANGVGAHYEYAPFGAITRTAKDTPVATEDFIAMNPFRYSSEYFDTELDLVYYNYRHYSPTDGRWLSRDPIEEKGGWNLYAFVKNNGISFNDLLGYLVETITTSYENLVIEPKVGKPRFIAQFHVSDFGGTKITCGSGDKILIKARAVKMTLGFNLKNFKDEKEFRASSAYSVHEKRHFEDFKKRYNEYASRINSYGGRKCCGCVGDLIGFNKALETRITGQIREDTMRFHVIDYKTDALNKEYSEEKGPSGEPLSRMFSETDIMFDRRVREAYQELIDGKTRERKDLESKEEELKRKVDECFKRKS